MTYILKVPVQLLVGNRLQGSRRGRREVSWKATAKLLVNDDSAWPRVVARMV